MEDNFDYKGYLKNNPLLNEIRVNNPNEMNYEYFKKHLERIGNEYALEQFDFIEPDDPEDEELKNLRIIADYFDRDFTKISDLLAFIHVRVPNEMDVLTMDDVKKFANKFPKILNPETIMDDEDDN